MRLRSPKLEHRLKRRVRRELRAIPGWRRLRRIHRGPLRFNYGWLRLLLPLAYVWFLAPGTGPHEMGIPLLLAAVALYATGVTFRLSARLIQELRSPDDLMPLACLPLSDQDIFDLQWQRLRSRSLWLLYYFIVAYALAAGLGHFSALGWLTALALALLQWPLALSLAAGLLALGNRRALETTGLFIMFGCIWLPFVIFSERAHQLVISSLDHFLPAGWITVAFSQGLLAGDPRAWWWLAPVALLAAASPLLLRRQRRRYILKEVPASAGSRLDFDNLVLTGLDDVLLPKPLPEPEDPSRAFSRQLLEAPDWSRAGFVERLAGRWLTPAQRRAAEFLLGWPPGWTRLWTVSALMTLAAAIAVLPVAPPWSWLTLAAALAIAVWFLGTGGRLWPRPFKFSRMIFLVLFSCLIWGLALRHLGFSPASALVAILAYPVGLYSLPFLVLGPWRGFTPPWGRPGVYPWALFPISWWDMVALVLKTNLVRCLFALPLLLVMGAIIGFSAGMQIPDPLTGLLIALKIFCLGLVTLPLLVFFFLVSDRINLRWWGVLLVIVYTVATIGAGIWLTWILFSSAVLAWQILSVLGLAALSTSWLAAYAAFYWRGTCDLVTTQRDLPGMVDLTDSTGRLG